MNVVEKVAAGIADIPGDPSSLEIARVAIEEYQRQNAAITEKFFEVLNMYPRDAIEVLITGRRLA